MESDGICPRCTSSSLPVALLWKHPTNTASVCRLVSSPAKITLSGSPQCVHCHLDVPYTGVVAEALN